VIELASTVPHAQRPAYYDGVVGKYCLAGCEGTTEGPRRAEPTTEEQRIGAAATTWEKLRSSTTLADLEAFAARYRDLYFAALAKARIDQLKKQQAGAAKSEADVAQQATKRKKAEEDARADAERQQLAMLQQGENRKRAEAEAARRPADAADAMQAGSVFRDCPECPEMVAIAAGEFTRGWPQSDKRHSHEGPERKVKIDRPFAVGRFEVTFEEWDACFTDGGCSRKPDDLGRGRGKRRPVVDVSWDDITKEYLPWLSHRTGKTYRLLTETEWEYAGRGGMTLSASGPEQASDAEEVIRSGIVDVGSFKPNAFGLYDMQGNVSERVQDCYDSYAKAPVDGSAFMRENCYMRVNRLNSWGVWATRIGVPHDQRGVSGFRVARTL
jgi:formylglycine-generating enzyme required for sulfatase activity